MEGNFSLFFLAQKESIEARFLDFRVGEWNFPRVQNFQNIPQIPQGHI